jgi:hypothetical protein
MTRRRRSGIRRSAREDSTASGARYRSRMIVLGHALNKINFTEGARSRSGYFHLRHRLPCGYPRRTGGRVHLDDLVTSRFDSTMQVPAAR